MPLAVYPNTIVARDEGSAVGSTKAVFNFVGAGVTVTTDPTDASVATVTIPGGGVGATVDGSFSCPSTVAVGDVVYKTTTASEVDKADADDATKQPVIGVVTAKPTSTTCTVQFEGECTVFSGLTPGLIYFLSTTPGQVVTQSIANGYATPAILQRIGSAKSATTMLLTIDSDFTKL